MLRLLLEKDRKGIKKEYRFRFVILLLSILAGIIVAWMIFLLPSYLSLSVGEKKYEEEVKKIEESGRSEERDEFALRIEDLNNKLDLLDTEDYSYTELIQVVKESTNGGVTLSLIDISHDKKEKLLFSVRGVAGNRDDLLKFSNKLEEHHLFEKAKFPFSDFAKDTEISFSITIDVKALE